MPEKSADWSIRRAMGSDIPFIYATWLQSFRCDSILGRSTSKTVYFKEYYGVLDAILSERSAKCIVACLPSETNVILGFLVFEPLIAHYCFTKESFRRLGIAKALYEAAFQGAGAMYYTHRTGKIFPILEKIPNVTYNPYLLFNRLFTSKPEEIDGKTE